MLLASGGVLLFVSLLDTRSELIVRTQLLVNSTRMEHLPRREAVQSLYPERSKA
jgi:hypothetical protein